MQKHVNLVDLVKSFQTNIYYLIFTILATFGFDTAENEPEYGYGISLIFVSLIFGPDLVSGNVSVEPNHEDVGVEPSNHGDELHH